MSEFKPIDFKVGSEVKHGLEHFLQLLGDIADYTVNPDDMQEFDFYASQLEAEYRFLLQRLEISETNRFYK